MADEQVEMHALVKAEHQGGECQQGDAQGHVGRIAAYPVRSIMTSADHAVGGRP